MVLPCPDPRGRVALDHWPAVRILVDLLNFDGPKFIDQTGGHQPLAERLAFLNPFECCNLVLVLGEFYSDQRVAAAALVLVERPIGNPHAPSAACLSGNSPRRRESHQQQFAGRRLGRCGGRA